MSQMPKAPAAKVATKRRARISETGDFAGAISFGDTDRIKVSTAEARESSAAACA
jgi:hypothetical protein